MKKIILLFAFLSFILAENKAQDIKYGWKAGFNPGANSDVGIRIDKGAGSFDLNLKRSKRDFSVGIWGSVKLSKFYISPELLLNSYGVEYLLNGPTISGVDTLKTDRFLKLDVPLMLGYRIGKAVFVKVGPSMHVNLSSKSGLTSIAGFSTKYAPVTFGYQFGVAFALSKKTQLEFRFNRFLDPYGKHLLLDGKEQAFAHHFRRMFLGLNFAL